MLIYHPAFDAYHCVFRMLLLIDSLPETEIDMLRLCDFYLVFPSEIERIRLPSTLSHGRKIAKSLSNVYRNPINAMQAFRDMAEIQLSALRSIAASGLIDIDCYEHGVVRKRSTTKLPEHIESKISAFFETNREITEFILNFLSKHPLRGLNGLKHRTGLLEYRYDTP
ncbi:ABC-three component system middle component 5 [Pseudomonas sp. NFACC36]|uniref:ABC-three component system middle component 5 n=1 Tax=Pseudomonas sp. NFACC36 TaxID=1566197 RepID=UPI000CDE9F56|nr:ABC-three component system middle component 5 [Pseudomonas sp. NFACC36]